jgi:hypothetical protein
MGLGLFTNLLKKAGKREMKNPQDFPEENSVPVDLI